MSFSWKRSEVNIESIASVILLKALRIKVLSSLNGNVYRLTFSESIKSFTRGFSRGDKLCFRQMQD